MGPKVKLPKSHGKTPIGATYFGGIFYDGGGFIIYPGHDGKLHIKRVPPWDPEVMGQLNLAASLVVHAERVADANIATEMRRLAQAVLNSQSRQVMAALSQVGD
jgi:hypothetical protein